MNIIGVVDAKFFFFLSSDMDVDMCQIDTERCPSFSRSHLSDIKRSLIFKDIQSQIFLSKLAALASNKKMYCFIAFRYIAVKHEKLWNLISFP